MNNPGKVIWFLFVINVLIIYGKKPDNSDDSSSESIDEYNYDLSVPKFGYIEVLKNTGKQSIQLYIKSSKKRDKLFTINDKINSIYLKDNESTIWNKLNELSGTNIFYMEQNTKLKYPLSVLIYFKLYPDSPYYFRDIITIPGGNLYQIIFESSTTNVPSDIPTILPTLLPSITPTIIPTNDPTIYPTDAPIDVVMNATDIMELDNEIIIEMDADELESQMNDGSYDMSYHGALYTHKEMIVYVMLISLLVVIIVLGICCIIIYCLCCVTQYTPLNKQNNINNNIPNRNIDKSVILQNSGEPNSFEFSHTSGYNNDLYDMNNEPSISQPVSQPGSAKYITVQSNSFKTVNPLSTQLKHIHIYIDI